MFNPQTQLDTSQIRDQRSAGIGMGVGGTTGFDTSITGIPAGYNAGRTASPSFIRPPNTGDAGMQGGPTGRTMGEVAATGQYVSDEERQWFLSQQAQAGGQLSADAQAYMASPAAPNTTATGANWAPWGENNSYNGAPFGALGRVPYTPTHDPYPPEVEQWRGLVAQYFKPADVDKALHVIKYESGGQSIDQYGGGPARGLFQIEDGTAHPGRPTREQLLMPEFNVAYAAQMVYGGY